MSPLQFMEAKDMCEKQITEAIAEFVGKKGIDSKVREVYLQLAEDHVKRIEGNADDVKANVTEEVT